MASIQDAWGKVAQAHAQRDAAPVCGALAGGDCVEGMTAPCAPVSSGWKR